MAFFFLCLTVFIMFFQPVVVFPQTEPLQPLRNFAIIALMFYFFSSRKLKTAFFSNKVNVYFILFILFQIASAFQVWWASSLEVLNYWLRIGIIYYLIIKSCTSLSRILWICAMIGLAVVYLSYYSYVNFIINYIPGQRAGGFGWYENPNDLSIILVSTIPLILLLSYNIQFSIGKLIFLSIAGVFSVNILFTASRNGLLGLAGTGFLCAYFSKSIPKFIRVCLIIVLGFGVLGVGVANVMQREGISGLRGDTSSEDRIIQWKAAANMLKARPLFGVGPNEFVSNASEFGGIRGLPPHNTIIQVFAETGIFGGIFFTLFGFIPLKEGFQYAKRNKQYSSIGLTYLFVSFALVGFWICAFFSNRYEFYILYVLVALTSAIKKNLLQSEQSSA